MNDLILCDCMDYMANCRDGEFDLCIVDPPYGIGVDGKNPIENKSDKDHGKFQNKSHDWDDSIPTQEYFNKIIRISKGQVIWGGNYFLDYLGYCKAPVIWDKLNGGSMFADGEMAWTGGNVPRNLKIFRHQWCGAFKNSERGVIKIHPTQKPIALYKWLLTNYAKPGMKLFDSHSGSGSFRIAAYDMGFDLISCELDPDYCRDNEARFQRHIQQNDLFDTKEIQKLTYKQGEL